MFRLWWLPVLLVLLPAAAPASVAAPDLTGQYRSGSGGMIVAIGSCDGGRMCGRIVGLGDLPSNDANNPTEDLRARPLCGLAIIDRLEWQNGNWRGTLYDPRNGTNYTIGMVPVQHGAVRVTGYSGQPVLSRTLVRPFEIWDRVMSGAAPCAAARVMS